MGCLRLYDPTAVLKESLVVVVCYKPIHITPAHHKDRHLIDTGEGGNLHTTQPARKLAESVVLGSVLRLVRDPRRIQSSQRLPREISLRHYSSTDVRYTYHKGEKVHNNTQFYATIVRNLPPCHSRSSPPPVQREVCKRIEAHVDQWCAEKLHEVCTYRSA